MDKTVNTHASNGALVKQSLPLPRTLFSEGGSVVFSELLAESTFRPERFALDLGVKKADLPSRAAQKAEPPQNSQDCLDCRQDEQKEILRGLNEQRAHDSASRERQELSQGAQQARDEQARLNAETETRLVAQRQVQQRQEEQYRAEQSDRLASQRQNSFDNEREARSLARRSSSEGASREREVQQARYEARADEAKADEKSRAAGRNQHNTERAPDASDDNRNRVATSSEISRRADTDTETREQASLATHRGGQEDKFQEGDSIGGGKDASQNAKGATNDKQEEARVASETPALSEDKTGKQKLAEETLPATTGEDKLENALAGLAEAEGIDIFALQDKHAQTAQAIDKDAAPLAPSLTTQGAAQEGELASNTRQTQQTGTISDTLVSRTSASLEGTDATTTNPVAQNPATQEGKSLEGKSLEGKSLAEAEQAKAEQAKAEQAKGVQTDELRRQGGGQDVPTNPDAANTIQEGRQKASVASVAAFPLVSNKLADSVVRDNAAKILAQAQQLDARAEQRAGLVAQKSSSATGDKPSTTTSAASDGSKESHARASDENNAPKNSQARSPDNAVIRHLTQAAEAQRAAGSARQAGEAAASTPRSAPVNTPPAASQAHALAQALSGSGTRATQGTLAQEKLGQPTASLPEGIEVRWNQEVRAHRPEGLRLSGQNAFDSLRLAGGTASTSSQGNAATQGSAQGSTQGSTHGSAQGSAHGASLESGASSATALGGADGNQAGLASSSAAAKLAARVAERQEAVRERRETASRETSSPATKSKASGTQALLQSLAARLTGARGEVAGSSSQAQTLGQALNAQGLNSQGLNAQGSNSQGSNSQGSNSESSFNNGFSQSLQGHSATSSARASAAPAFTTASSFVREQVFVNIQRAVEGNLESMTVKLRPELLGRIEIRLDGDASGRLHIVVLAERGETLDLLQRDAKQLEQALQEAGVRTQDQGLQFGLKGQGNAQTEGEAQRQNAGGSLSSDANSDTETEGSESASDEETSSSASVIDRLQVRQDGRLNVKV